MARAIDTRYEPHCQEDKTWWWERAEVAKDSSTRPTTREHLRQGTPEGRNPTHTLTQQFTGV